MDTATIAAVARWFRSLPIKVQERLQREIDSDIEHETDHAELCLDLQAEWMGQDFEEECETESATTQEG